MKKKSALIAAIIFAVMVAIILIVNAADLHLAEPSGHWFLLW